MSRTTRFYEVAKTHLGDAYDSAKPHVASVADDVRHKLVEEGWFGKQVTGNIAEAEEPETPPTAMAKHYSLYAEVWGQEPSSSDLYGKTVATAELADVPEQDDGQSPDLVDLDTPLLSIGGEIWSTRDACEAVGIWGAPGSGKSSSSGRMIAHAFLRAGFGGLVLAAKNDVCSTWRQYARETGREDDLVVIDATGAHRFNILDYAAKTLGGRGFEHNLVAVMQTMTEATRVASTNAGDASDNRYFVDGALKWCSHAFPLLQLVEGTIRLKDLNRFIASLPKSEAEVDDPKWITSSYCARIIFDVAKLGRGEDEAVRGYARQLEEDHSDFFLTEVAGLDNRPRSSIESTLTNMIYPFLTGKLAELFCTETTVTPEACREGKIIILDLPVHQYGATGVVAQTLFKYLFGVCVQNTNITPDTRPVYAFLDEAQFFLNSTDDDLLSTARSSKTCLVYITQDLPTYYARLGSNARDKAEAILSKIGTRLFHANTSRETNQYASEIIGKVQKTTLNRTQSRTATSGGGGSHTDEGIGFQGQGGRSNTSSESTTNFHDYEIPPDHFATKLRTGAARNGYKADAIMIRNGRTWKRTGRHWIQAEFDQR